MFHTHDTGCFADGSFGHDHVRATLANLLELMFRHHPRGGDGVHWGDAAPLVAELRGEMSDDASEEYDAINMLNTLCCASGVYFTLEDGDLVLTESEDSDV